MMRRESVPSLSERTGPGAVETTGTDVVWGSRSRGSQVLGWILGWPQDCVRSFCRASQGKAGQRVGLGRGLGQDP